MNYLDNNFNKIVGNLLEKYRNDKNLSLEELAKKIDYIVTRQTLQRYEKNGQKRGCYKCTVKT